MAFKPPSALAITDNVANDWVNFKDRFSLFLTATETENKLDQIKVAQFLNVIGEEAYDIFKNFKLGPLDSIKYSAVIKAIDDYFLPKRNIVYQRFLFFKRSQKPGETFSNFLTDLKKLAHTCEFGDQEESLIRDRLVLSLSSNDELLQERLLRIPDIKFEDAVKHCTLWETSSLQFKEVIGHKQGV
ncbi:uncharacterized protein LOC120353235 [Nilaparvata lugens]|uniref:uncharacterized protein LOC120353235 n=1 Tax=Nilaparvata lugens TaxID=108931 RepID=UPI00193D5384|nr:uncharacterized protein LOC120353235 [Nilaparvata lugens]